MRLWLVFKHSVTTALQNRECKCNEARTLGRRCQTCRVSTFIWPLQHIWSRISVVNITVIMQQTHSFHPPLVQWRHFLHGYNVMCIADSACTPSYTTINMFWVWAKLYYYCSITETNRCLHLVRFYMIRELLTWRENLVTLLGIDLNSLLICFMLHAEVKLI